MANTKLTQFEVLAVAAESMTDPRTVKRYLAGGRVQETSLVRIVNAMAKLAKKAR